MSKVTEAQKELKLFCEQIDAIDNEIIGAAFKNYISENQNDVNWEGFSTRDMTGVRRLLSDFLTYFYALGNV